MFNGDLVETKRILYTPSDFARKNFMHLQEIGKLQALKPHISKRDKLTSYLFFMVLSGSGILQYEGTDYRLSAGDCVFIDCRKAYSHYTSDNLWQLRWVHFYGTNLCNIYDKYIERGGFYKFHPIALSDFEEIWFRIYEAAASSDYINDLIINSELNSLLTLIVSAARHQDALHIGSKKRNLLEIKNYLNEHYADKILLDDLSDTFFINKFYLTRVFKEQFGISINSYLLQIRITHAKQLLRFTDKTVESIGIECGMGAVNYFSRTFKKVEGISPSEYRKMW